jgi:prepilin-type N-terminal cleavage/methylation domain-containing protein
MHLRVLLKPTNYNLKPSFTLIELIVVMAIMAIVMTISVYQFRRGEVRQDLRSAADDITAAWQEMRTRALAGTRTPTGARYYDDSPGGGLSAQGYGLLLYGTEHNQDINILNPTDCPIESDDPCYYFPSENPIDPSFIFRACAVPREVEKSDRCYIPLPEYSPVMASTVYVDKSTIAIGADTANMYTFLDQSSGWLFRETNSFNFFTCQLSGDPIDNANVDYPTITSLFLRVAPPQPIYFMNGGDGCKIFQFKLKSTQSDTAELWVRFDLNTGAVRTYDSEPT